MNYKNDLSSKASNINLVILGQRFQETDINALGLYKLVSKFQVCCWVDPKIMFIVKTYRLAIEADLDRCFTWNIHLAVTVSEKWNRSTWGIKSRIIVFLGSMKNIKKIDLVSASAMIVASLKIKLVNDIN